MPLTGFEFGQIWRAFLHGLGLALMMGRPFLRIGLPYSTGANALGRAVAEACLLV